MPNLYSVGGTFAFGKNRLGDEKYQLSLGLVGRRDVNHGTVEYDRMQDGVAVPKRRCERFATFATERMLFKE